MSNLKQTMRLVVFRSVYIAIYIVSQLPMKFLYAMASIAFLIVYRIAGYRKEVVVQNISRAFPEKQYGEIHAIVKKFYACFVSYFAEIIKNVSIEAKILDQKITFENLELIDQYIKSGRIVIVALGHCGNWEMLSFLPHKIHHDVYAIYKPLKSKLMNRLMIKIRSRFGMKLLPDQLAIRHILNHGACPAVYLFLADQCPRIKDEAYQVELLNQQTYMFSGMEKIASTLGAAVIYLHITQTSKGNYKISCIPISAKAESAKKGEITQQYADLLTENINEEPYGWLWTHKRWKS